MVKSKTVFVAVRHHRNFYLHDTLGCLTVEIFEKCSQPLLHLRDIANRGYISLGRSQRLQIVDEEIVIVNVCTLQADCISLKRMALY